MSLHILVVEKKATKDRLPQQGSLVIPTWQADFILMEGIVFQESSIKIDEGACLTVEDVSLVKSPVCVENSIKLTGFSEKATYVSLAKV